MQVLTNNPHLAETATVAPSDKAFGTARQSAWESAEAGAVALSPGNSQFHITAARLRLELASTTEERRHAIAAAVELGMPFWQIEQYLDWLDVSRAYQASVGDSLTWMTRLSSSISTTVRAGVDVLRRAGRRVFGSANPA